MDKKADVAMNLIVAAAIALVVLIVILAIFTGRLNLFGQGVQNSQQSALKTICIEDSATKVCRCADAKPAQQSGYADWTPKTLIGATWSDCSLPSTCWCATAQ